MASDKEVKIQNELSYQAIEINKPFSIGKLTLSETDIIEYAKLFDPLEFHIDKEAAKKSIFGELIASGPQIFQVMHCKHFLPLFGKTILAGLEVNNWKFLKPTFPNREIECIITIVSKTLNSGKKTVTIKWLYEFKYTSTQELIQHMTVTALHKV